MTERCKEDLISEAKKIISYNIEKRKNSGGDYNIFSTLGIERHEVFTHSNMIYSFLNPDSGHFMGKEYLKLFVKHVLEFNDPIELSKEWYAEREWPFSGGRIDFVVFSDNRYVAIEMKIDAYDQEAQLSRYEKYAKTQNRQNYDVFYLSLNGKGASTQSALGLEKAYRRISFSKHIMEWLNRCIGVTSVSNKAYNALIQYRELVEKLIFDQNQKGVGEMSVILQNATNYRAYLELVKSEQTMKQAFLEKFFHAFGERLKQVDSGFKNDVDLDTSLFLSNPSNRIGFSLDTGKKLSMSNGKQYNLIFRIDVGEREGNMALGFSLSGIKGGQIVNGNINVMDAIKTEDDKDNLHKVLDNEYNNAAGIFENGWIYWDYIYSRKNSCYNLRSFNDPIIDMLDKENFGHEMDRIIGTINNHLSRIKQDNKLINNG